ncbi:MAG: tetratricopeptide repeat protein [Ignavibacteriales bacterium]|nr:tetratricopeptide repeat protein [Ignavibacteriales bacterium]
MKLRLFLFSFFFPSSVLVVSLTGCSVFSPLGDALAAGYENTVAYFNSYYNAKRLFDEAEEEIRANERTTRARVGPTPAPVLAPPSAKQKLTVVIDKCSYILSFHPSSALVDDALVLIGKSYFHQGDYLKAERKFAELLSGFPESSVAPEAELWFVKTLARLNKQDEAIEAAQLLVQREEEVGGEIVAETFVVLGNIYSLQDNPAKAIEVYQEAVARSSADVLTATALYRIGDGLSGLGQWDQAASSYRRVEEYTDEMGLVISGRLRAIRALRSAGRPDHALEVCTETQEDFRFNAFQKEIRLEKGLTLAALGSYDLAIQELIVVDTSSVRTEIGSKAAYEAAKLHEFRFGDYRAALDAYARAITYPVPAIYDDARKRHSALNQYFSLLKQRDKRDSLLATPRTPSGEFADDSVIVPITQAAIDSLEREQVASSFEIGEIFYAELENPDSAVSWYKRAMPGLQDSARSARVLFVLAELSAVYPEKGYGAAEELYQRIIKEYPTSVYAIRSKRQLGIPVEPAAADSGQFLYRNAEKLIESGKYDDAIKILRTIVRDHPVSPYAAKSEYATGWLYEYRLAKPDSALNYYKSLVESYGTSSYAAAVRHRIRREVEETPVDTTKKSLPPPARESESVPKKEELPIERIESRPQTRKE